MEIKFNEVGYKSKLSYTTFTIPISITGVIGKNKQFEIMRNYAEK